jgi:threonine synthase
VADGTQDRPSTAEWAGGWNRHARLSCISCAYETGCAGPAGEGTATAGAVFASAGCPRCGGAEGPSPLEVVYAPDDAAPSELAESLTWLAAHRLPISREAMVSLGRPVTPLVPQPGLGPGVYVKNESLNPTWGHKDRTHEITVGVARLTGARGIVTSTTGNHGAAAAAHAAAAGLPSVVFCHPLASAATMQMITAYGGIAVQVEPSQARQALIDLVDGGWFPATGMDPAVSGRSNPFGAEGYKSISLEVAAQLGEIPAVVIVPTASGDTLYGIAKGFAEISELTGEPMPRIVSAQPEQADPLARSLAAGHPVSVPDAHSLALSVADASTGRHALAALQRWAGSAVSVPEGAIIDAVRRLARRGYLAEPASAVALAGLRELLPADLPASGRPVVLILTSSGVKWPEQTGEIFPGQPLRSLDKLSERIAATHLVGR